MGKAGKIVTKTDSTGLAAWTRDCQWLARAARVTKTLKPYGVELRIQFVFAKPKTSKIDAPTVKPDIDKTLRACLDALTGIAYEDDSQVLVVSAEKSYHPKESSTTITVIPLDIPKHLGIPSR